MIGEVEVIDPLQNFIQIELSFIDFPSFANDAGDDAKTVFYLRRVGDCKWRERSVEQFGVQLISLTVEIQIGPGDEGMNEICPLCGDMAK